MQIVESPQEVIKRKTGLRQFEILGPSRQYLGKPFKKPDRKLSIKYGFSINTGKFYYFGWKKKHEREFFFSVAHRFLKSLFIFFFFFTPVCGALFLPPLPFESFKPNPGALHVLNILICILWFYRQSSNLPTTKVYI